MRQPFKDTREGAMRYLCLIYSEEKQFPKLPETELKKVMNEYLSFGEGIKQSGHYITAARLQPTHTATTVRSRNGRISTTDGPFAETKEQLGGFYMIEAKDLDDAIAVASRIPGTRVGSIEVRPIWELNA
jgi:hypothetical protein